MYIKIYKMLYIDNLEEYLNTVKTGITAVKFTAEWCGPCRKIAPLFEDLSVTSKSIKFLTVDIDKQEDVSIHEEVQSIPQFKFYQDGKELIDKRISGADSVRLTNVIVSLNEKVINIVKSNDNPQDGIVVKVPVEAELSEDSDSDYSEDN